MLTTVNKTSKERTFTDVILALLALGTTIVIVSMYRMVVKPTKTMTVKSVLVDTPREPPNSGGVMTKKKITVLALGNLPQLTLVESTTAEPDLTPLLLQ